MTLDATPESIADSNPGIASVASTSNGDRSPTASRERRPQVGAGIRVPVTARGRRTYDRLLAAAIEVFDRAGYLGANVDDVVARAGTSHGTFYTYFSSKRDVFQAVAQSLADEVLGSPYEIDEPAPTTVYERVARTNRRYLDSYRHHARLMDLLEQMAMVDAETKEARRIVRHEFVERAARFVDRLQRDGLAHADLDAWSVANSLCAMVDRVAYVWFVLGEASDFEETALTVSMLWVRALGADPDAPLPTSFQSAERNASL